jgi:GTP cyclohydrolase I/GTP cyclohydrolase-4
MSSEIYELMKRTDEASVVEKAHRNPRFVEDVVREMVRRVAEAYPGLRNGGYLLARQENLETIHRHTVVAERSGMVAEVLQEIETGEHSKRHVSEREWLEEPCADGA